MSSTSGRVLALSAALGIVAAALGCRRGESSPAVVPNSKGSNGDDAATMVDSMRPVMGEQVEAIPPGDPGVADIYFEVAANSGAHAISPLIYGINYDVRDMAARRWGIIRSGGNRLTAYNWENNASNAGSDYLFQNDGLMSESDAPAKPLLDIIDAAAAISAATVITLSTADYVAADKNGGGDVRASGPGYLSTRFKRNYAKKPTPIAGVPDPTDNAVYQDEFVSFLKAQRPRAKLLFSLDNEPELWSHTHAEIFPSPVTYADLWKRNHDFAKAAKAVWPTAEVLGFVSYGYTGYVSLQNAPDGNGRNFIEWYLDQASAAEKSGGVRLIDYLDLHWYPEAQGGGQRITEQNDSPAVVTAREQAPRSLWDKSYEETSWIRDAAGGPIDLIHWVKKKIDAHYPGTKLAFTEWNYGGGNHISGAIAVADVVGIFGKYGVSLATYWPLVQDEPFAYAGFRAFRNYDGRGAAFGDTSVAASSSDAAQASVYASIDSKDPTRTVIVAINKALSVKRAGIKLTHSSAYGTAKVFVLAGSQPAFVPGSPLTAVAANAFKYDMPAQSVSVIVPSL